MAETTIDKSGARIQEMFGEIAPRYDFLNHLLSGGVDRYWRSYTIRKIAPEGTSPILDVCTGTGDLALAYWKKGKGMIPVTGVDFTKEMIVRAREKAVRLKKGNLEVPTFLEGDAQQLPFEENLFQIVSCAFGLRNICDPLAGLKEMTRVCRPGGRVAILEFSLPGNPLIRGPYVWYFRNILPRIGQFFSRNKHLAYDYLPKSVSKFPQGAELASLMSQAGLEETGWQPLTFGIATLYWGRKPSLV